ncbi:putative 115 kDa protein in type-1 retrotransposable element R1DM [Trichonephila clavipes]|nr:putative 115 kDa protein in type-1 retrotransposable element R1DM [Trichonephila clavipes]
MPTKAFHSVIWKNCPKETFVSKKRLEMGVISAIGGYNFGCFNSLAIEHNELSSVSVDISHKRDKRRLAQSEKKNSSDWRKKRIINKLAKSSKNTKNIKKKGKHMVLKRIELSGIALPSGAMTNSFEETINEVLFHSFPDDCENEDDDCHKEIRSDALIYTSVTDDPPFTIHEINAVINKLKLKKAPGPDSIPNEVVKKLHEMYPVLFLTVFNSCLRLKTFPRCWKNAKIILIPKVNDVRVPKKKRNLHTVLVFLDIKSAFDNAWWPGILSLLKRSSIPGNLFAVISSFLKDRSVTLSLGHSSKEKFLNKGCPQGSVSGPFLWNVIINDFLEKILAFSSCETIAFADDLLLCFQGKSFHDICRQAQLTLDFASTWTKNFKLEFNAVKSKVMFLEKREKNALTGNLTLNGFSLDCVKELKYLGVVLDSKFCWKQHVLHLSNKCEKILLGLNKVARNSFGIKSNVSSLIYKQGIVPFICYGSQIWGSALKKKIYCRLLRKIQRRILLRVISGYRTISYEAVFAISGFPPIDIFIIRNNEFKIATKNCTNKCLDGSLRVSELPHPSERFPLNLVNYRKNIENNFPVVCFTDGSKINSKVGLAFVIFQDFIEIGTRQFRIRDECSVFQAELLCIAQAVSWICNNEILSSNFLICSDSLSSLCALNNIYSQNKLIVKTHINLDFLRSRGVQVFFSFVRGHTGIYGNERADWLAKEATKLRNLVPMSIPKSYHKKVFKEKIISEWNNLYQISINAHLTKEFFPSIQSRLKAKHFHPNFKLTQLLTGHGNFKAYLKRFNLSLTDQCSCSSDTI